MKKIAITKEILEIANELDDMRLYSEANTLTKIAKIIVAENYKHDPMVYNPDDEKADAQEAHSMDYLDAMEALNKLVESGELNPHELSQIQSILSDSDDEGPDPFKEMSNEDDDFELGLGAVPHTRIKNPKGFDEKKYDDHDYDLSLSDDDDDEDDEDVSLYYEDDRRTDKNHKENDGHYFFQDEDDF